LVVAGGTEFVTAETVKAPIQHIWSDTCIDNRAQVDDQPADAPVINAFNGNGMAQAFAQGDVFSQSGMER